ncbi:hypothetical protein CPLU01_11821 [Colletotrichum plurivorum]|uniref:Uncharacterized protein n=1 Tax=Colletotrichum plurivorum TaxID=2175906 RepID=A0A8H6N7Z3_9PEZI|nr:hypothetical protein CPLU01_11821 [Colletotrichum plurivorum]
MGRGRNRGRALKSFIDEIPEAKLENFPGFQQTLHRDENFRLDMQGMTSNDEWNLQIQVITSLNELAPDTVAGPVLVSKTASLTADQIRAAFKASSRI